MCLPFSGLGKPFHSCKVHSRKKLQFGFGAPSGQELQAAEMQARTQPKMHIQLATRVRLTSTHKGLGMTR
jgi:hypothetical protein